jgi:P27 family predicted phage terminase small subunit
MAPDWLSPAALLVYDRTAATLHEQGRPFDVETLAAYASAVAQHAEASQLVSRSAVLVRGEGDRLIRNPALAAARDAAQTMARLARQLGLNETTPEPKVRRGSRNQRGAETMIAALRQTGRLEACDEGVVALVRTLAAAIDQTDPIARPAQLASLSRAYANALRQLRGQDVDDAANAGLDELLAALGDVSQP